MIKVETEPTCRYCMRRPSVRMCGNCGRILCEGCYQGLGCPRRKCHSRPDGSGVR